MDSFSGILQEKQKLTSDVFLFRFKLDKKIEFTAGQYVMVFCPTTDGYTTQKMYSISSSSNQKDEIDLLVKIFPGGVASTYFKSLKIGDKVDFQGPAGTFTLHENDKDKVFIATGAGIAPILSMIRTHLEDNPRRFLLLWGVKSKADSYFVAELEKLKNKYPDKFHFYICLSRQKVSGGQNNRFISGRVNIIFEMEFPVGDSEALNKYDYYLCGDKNVVEDLNSFLVGHSVERANIYSEKFI